MAVIESGYQSLALSSKITTTFDPDGNAVESRSSQAANGSLSFLVSLPAGSIINSCDFYCDYSGGTMYGGTTKINDVAVSSGNSSYSQRLAVITSVTIPFYFKSYSSTSGGPYTPSYTQTRTFSNCRIKVDYVAYTGCSAPTAVSTPTDVAPGADHTLSWSGAEAGTNNVISGYQVYRATAAGGPYTALGSKVDTSASSGSMAVTSHASNGSTYFFKVATLGTVAGYDSGVSSVYATMKTTVTDPTPPTTVSTPTDVAPESLHQLTWSGAGAGTNNALSSYEIYRSTDDGANYALLATADASPLEVLSPPNNGGKYHYKVKAIGQRSSSALSSVIATLKTTVGAPGVPSAVSVADGSSVAPGKPRTLSWSGASNGTNNLIRGYHVYRSVNGGNYEYLDEVLTSAASGCLVVTAALAAAVYTFKILVLGSTLSVNSALSSSYSTLVTATIPSTGVLTASSVVATGTDKVGIWLTPQAETSYWHKVTWYIPDTAYTSGEVTLSAGDLYGEYSIPQTWILATTKTTTSITAACSVETFNGTSSIGSNVYTYIVSVPPKSTFELSKVSVTADSSDENTATILPAYTGYSHKVSWSTSGYSSGLITLASQINTHAFSVPIDWNHSAPFAESFTVTCIIETFKDTSDGSLSLGSNSRTFTANVPAALLPVVSSFSADQVNPQWSMYLRTKTRCTLTPRAEGAYSSIVTSYRIVGATQDSGTLVYDEETSWTTNTLSVHGTITFTLMVTDSRGRISTQTLDITVVDYRPPSITGVTFARAADTGAVNNTGTCINAKADFTYSAIGDNSISARAYYRRIGTYAWLPAGGVPIAHATLLTYGSGEIDQLYLYETRITLSDYFTTVEHLGTVQKAVKVFDLREDRAAFGAYATNTRELYIPADWKIVIGTETAATLQDISNAEARAASYRYPYKKVLIYYGYPIAINGVWTVEGAVNIFKAYDICVFGNSYNDPAHEVYAQTRAIMDRLKVAAPDTHMVGYVAIGLHPDWPDSGLTMAQLKQSVDLWIAMGVSGIFLDEFGYDYQVTRARQNEIVAYCHDNGLFVFVNSWSVDYVFSQEPMTLDWLPDFAPNPNSLSPLINQDDYYLYENLFYTTTKDENGVVSLTCSNVWRIDDVNNYFTLPRIGGKSYYEVYGTRLCSLDGIPSTFDENQRMILRSLSAIGAAILNIHAVAFGDENWGATGHFEQWDSPLNLELASEGLHGMSTYTRAYMEPDGTMSSFPYKWTALLNGKTWEITFDIQNPNDVAWVAGTRYASLNGTRVENAWTTVFSFQDDVREAKESAEQAVAVSDAIRVDVNAVLPSISVKVTELETLITNGQQSIQTAVTSAQETIDTATTQLDAGLADLEALTSGFTFKEVQW